jgi:acetolactate synthase-1/2/3 large subunit
MNTAQAIIKSLQQFGVKRVYGLIGTSILDLVDATMDSGIRYISTRHEQVAVSMADAQGRLTGNLGVCFIHGGPGFLNALIGVANAYKDSSPLLMIAGAVKRRLSGLDSWLEVPQLKMIEPIVKKAFRVDRSSDASQVMAEAYSTTMAPPKGPVFIDVPEDVWRLDGAIATTRPVVKLAPIVGPDEVRRVMGLLTRSQRPLILVGGGLNVPNGAQFLEKVVDMFGIPVASTGNGRGVLPEDHKLSLGRVGFGGGSTVADSALESADLVIALGAGISDVTTYGYNLTPKGEIVVVDLDPIAKDKPVPYSLRFYGDAASFVEQMGQQEISYKPSEDWYKFIEKKRESWSAQLDDAAARNPEGYVNPSRFFKALDAKMPRDTVVTAGQGFHILYTYAFLRIKRPGCFLAATNLGAMGFAFPAALGAKVTLPEREVIAVLGDGEFLMTLQDLETAVREKIAVKIIVVNDNSYRVLLMRQKIQKMGRVFGTVHGNPDMNRLAEAFGAESMVVGENTAIDRAVDFTLAQSARPRIIELKISPDDVPPLNMDASLKF